MDKHFEIFNSIKVPNSKCYKRHFKNTSVQIEHLSIMLSFLKKFKIVSMVNSIDVTSWINFVNGWLISINGLLKLWVSLYKSIRYPSDYVFISTV